MNWRKKTLIELALACSLIALPFISFLHLFFEDEIAGMNFFGVQFNHGFKSNEIFVWYVITNFCQILLTSCFFLFSTKGFRYFFIPLVIHYWLLLIPAFFRNYSYVDFALSLEGVLSSIILLDLLLFANSHLFLELRFKVHTVTLGDILGEVVQRRNENLNNRISDVISAQPNEEIAKPKLYQIYHLLNLTKSKTIEFNGKIKVVGSRFARQDYLVSLALIFCLTINFLDEIPLDKIGLKPYEDYELYAYGFIDFKTFLWYISWKACIILTSMIWYIFNPYWWRNAILPGICLYLYQFYEIFQETQNIEDYNNFRIVPVVLVNLIILIIISKVIRSRARIVDNLELLNKEFIRGIESVAVEN